MQRAAGASGANEPELHIHVCPKSGREFWHDRSSGRKGWVTAITATAAFSRGQREAGSAVFAAGGMSPIAAEDLTSDLTLDTEAVRRALVPRRAAP